MTKKYRRYQPNQEFLMPPNLRDWLPDNHLAYFISDTVDSLDLSEIFVYYECSERGQPPYHPAMMVKVILYGYCVGVASSRKIAKALEEDVAFRVLGAMNFPDFRTISEFRRIHLDALKGLFVDVLQLCKAAGLFKLGVVALDGTKVKANASIYKNRKYEKLCEEEKQLRDLVENMLEEAESIDSEEDRIYGQDRRGDELPNGFRTKKERLERIRKAKQDLEQVQREKHQEYQEKLAERKQKEEESGKKRRGRKPKPVPEKPDNDKKRNTTDPDSRIMKTRKGYIQGYNAQAAVDSENQIIVANDVTQDCNDSHQLAPMMEQVEENTGQRPKKGTADAGYCCEDQINQVSEDIDLYIATNKDWKQRKALREQPPPRGRIPKNMSTKDRMERKLRTKKGKQTYKKRGKTVEPVFGQIKDARGIKRFLLRGLRKVKGEWSLITMTHNLLKLWRKSVTSG